MTNRMHELLTKYVGKEIEVTLCCGETVDGKLKELDQGIAVFAAPAGEPRDALEVGCPKCEAPIYRPCTVPLEDAPVHEERRALAAKEPDGVIEVRIDQIAVVDGRFYNER